MTSLFVQPNDVVLFRDGRSFSAGDDHRAVGIFPPPPTPFYGAVRSAILSHHDAVFLPGGFQVQGPQRERVLREVGSPAEPGDLTIRHFSLARYDGRILQPLFPLPQDVLVFKKDTANPARSHQPILVAPTVMPAGAQANMPIPGLSFLWHRHSERDYFENTPALLDEHAFLAYLAGSPPPPPLPLGDRSPLAHFYQQEPRTSLQIGAAGTAAEGRLFTVEFTRLHPDLGFALSLDHASSLDSSRGLLRLGGEARSASYEQARWPGFDPEGRAALREAVVRDRAFRLVLITPAVFDGGWLPDFISDPDARSGHLAGCRVRLDGAALGRYQHLGGWDLAHNRPRPTRRAVPAGSVYFLRIEEGDAGRLFDTLFGRSVLFHADDPNRPSEDGRQGLGLAYLGAWHDSHS